MAALTGGRGSIYLVGLIVLKSIGAATADPGLGSGNGLHMQFKSRPIASCTPNPSFEFNLQYALRTEYGVLPKGKIHALHLSCLTNFSVRKHGNDLHRKLICAVDLIRGYDA